MKPFILPTKEVHPWGKRITSSPFYYSQVLRLYGLSQKEGDGIEVVCEVWFKKKPLFFCFSFVYWRLMEGDIGPSVGGMGALLQVGSLGSRLFEMGIGKLVPALQEVGYEGCLSIRTIVSKEGLSLREPLAGINYTTIHPLLEIYKGRWQDLLNLQVVSEFKSNVAIGMKLAIPPFPYILNQPATEKIESLSSQGLKHLWLSGIEKGVYRGWNGILGAATARGDLRDGWSPFRDAQRRVLRTTRNLRIESLMYRRDIGARAEEWTNTLKRWQWI